MPESCINSFFNSCAQKAHFVHLKVQSVPYSPTDFFLKLLFLLFFFFSLFILNAGSKMPQKSKSFLRNWAHSAAADEGVRGKFVSRTKGNKNSHLFLCQNVIFGPITKTFWFFFTTSAQTTNHPGSEERLDPDVGSWFSGILQFWETWGPS